MKDIKTLVHGDDFVLIIKRRDVSWLQRKVEESFEIKTKVVESGPGEAAEERVSNRVVRVGSEGWEYEPDQRHAELIIQGLGLQDAKPVQTPVEEDKPWKQDENEQVLNELDARNYRGLAARAN